LPNFYPRHGYVAVYGDAGISRSALLPRQPIKAPAIVGGPLMVVVEFTLEAVEHVVNVAETVLFQVLAGFL
jgi:hypothetical protein